MKRIIVSIGVLLLTLNGFGWYNLKNSTLDTVYEWADKSTWNGTQPTNFVNDAFYCSKGNGASATRTYVNPGYYVDFTALGLGQWAGQTSIVHVAENAYLGVHNGVFAMCSNADYNNTGKKSYAELHMEGATLEVYNLEGVTTARDLTLGGGNAGGISIVDLQQGSVITNGTSGKTIIAGAAEAVASIGVTNSAIYAPSGSITVGSASNSSHVSIDLHNGLFYGGSSAAPSSAMTVNGGDFALSMSGKSEFKVASFESKLSLVGQKQSIEVSDGTLMITNATSGNGKMTFSSVAGSLKLLQSGGLIRSDAFTVTTTSGSGDFSMAVSNAAVFKAASMTMYPNAGTSQTIDLSDSSLDLGSGGLTISGAGDATFRQTGGTTQIGKLTLKTTVGTGGLSMAVSNAAVVKATSVTATAEAGTKQAIDFADSSLDLGSGTINLTSSGELDFRQTGGKVLGGEVTLSANDSGELSFAVSGETELQMTKFSPTVAANAKLTVEVGGGLFAVTNAVSGESQRIKLEGAGQILFRQTGGVVTAAGLYFNGTGDNEPRYELSGGALDLDWTLGCNYAGVRCATAAGTKAGTLSLIGGGALLQTPMFGAYNSTTYQPLFEYVITTNGIPRAQFTKAQDSASSWLQGFFKIRPQGGLQLVHTNVINLVDTRTAGRTLSVANFGTGTKLPNEELWDAKLAERGTSMLADLPVTLVPAAEFKSDTYCEAGRSSGYAVVPKVKQDWKKITVMLDLLPQGDETLETLKAGFVQAGFKASAAEGDYNVAVEIPGELLSVDSADDKVVFDFKDYPDSNSVRLDTPKVRALVRRCKVVKPATGMILIFR